MELLGPLTVTAWILLAPLLLVFSLVSNVWPKSRATPWLAVAFVANLFAAVALSAFLILIVVWR